MTRALPALVAATWILAAASVARAEEGPRRPTPTVTIELDIAETLDGKPDPDGKAAARIEDVLREFGFAMTVTAVPVTGKPATPTADLIISGTIDVRKGKTSLFYEQEVAWQYIATAELKIRDGKTGKVLTEIVEREDLGGTESRETTLAENRARIYAWVRAGVLRADAIRGRLGPKRQAALDQYVGGDPQAQEEELKKPQITQTPPERESA
jgi:hypothetical protein